jgi:Reverse transcriptase (RNA-dependent DNA polymerase)
LHVLGLVPAVPRVCWRLQQNVLGEHAFFTEGMSVAETNLNSAIRRSVRSDRRQRTEAVGESIQTLLEGNENNVREAWQHLQPWYRHSSGQPTKPSHLDLQEVEETYTALYAAVPSPGPTISVHYIADRPIYDECPTAAEILVAVHRLKNGKAPGPSKLRTEDVKRWAEERESNPEPWNKFVDLIFHVFTTGEIPQRLCFSILVLIPKPSGGIRGIGLLETVWKVISLIINARIISATPFSNTLHGFRANRGTGTAILEAWLNLDVSIQQGLPLHHVFLDISKAYDTVDRSRLLILLQAYGMGPNLLRILRNFWDSLQLVPRQNGYYG